MGEGEGEGVDMEEPEPAHPIDAAKTHKIAAMPQRGPDLPQRRGLRTILRDLVLENKVQTQMRERRERVGVRPWNQKDFRAMDGRARFRARHSIVRIMCSKQNTYAFH